MIIEQAAGDPVRLGQDDADPVQERATGVANPYIRALGPDLHVAQVAGPTASSRARARPAPASGRRRGPARLTHTTMATYIVRRLLWTVLLLFVISCVTFLIFYVLPAADPAALRAGRDPSPERDRGDPRAARARRPAARAVLATT